MTKTWSLTSFPPEFDGPKPEAKFVSWTISNYHLYRGGSADTHLGPRPVLVHEWKMYYSIETCTLPVLVFLSCVLAETVDRAGQTILMSDYSPIMYFCSVFATFLDSLQSKFVSAPPEEPKQTEVSDLTTHTHTQTHTNVAVGRVA